MIWKQSYKLEKNCLLLHIWDSNTDDVDNVDDENYDGVENDGGVWDSDSIIRQLNK